MPSSELPRVNNPLGRATALACLLRLHSSCCSKDCHHKQRASLVGGGGGRYLSRADMTHIFQEIKHNHQRYGP
jgi:hypothetical protein